MGFQELLTHPQDISGARLGEDRATSRPPSPPSPRNANVFLQNGAAHRIPIQSLTRTVENVTQGAIVWWPEITKEKDKAAEQTEMPTCAGPAFPEGDGEGSQIQEDPCLFRAALSVEHLYCGFQVFKKLVKEATGKQGLASGAYMCVCIFIHTHIHTCMYLYIIW